MRIKAVIWDLDGTLLDTLSDLAASTNAALVQNGLKPYTKEQIGGFVGNGVRNLIRRATPGGEENPAFEKIFEAFLAHYAQHSMDLTRPYEGITELLDLLSRRGIRHAIVSNKIETAVRELNRTYFGQRVEIALGDDPSRPRKPAPDAVFEAMRLLGVSAEEAVYIGDSQVDIHTADNAGIPLIAVSWGFRTEECLREAGAQRIARNPQELLEWMERI